MTGHFDDWDEFERVVRSLEPYLDQLVVVGGWAHRLHAIDARAVSPNFEPLMTLDVDVAMPESMPMRKDSIHALLSTAGLRCELAEARLGASSRYRAADHTGVSVEFITQLRGSGARRDGTHVDTVSIAGVTAMRLRHAELLLEEPWAVALRRTREEEPRPEAIRVQVANPACFMGQKILVLSRRDPEKRAKDVLYIHDTLALFSPSLQELAASWQRVRPRLHARQLRDLDAIRRETLETVTDYVRRAARIAFESGRRDPPSPEQLAHACRLGLEQVFGG